MHIYRITRWKSSPRIRCEGSEGKWFGLLFVIILALGCIMALLSAMIKK